MLAASFEGEALKRLELVGQRFGSLEVAAFAGVTERKPQRSLWLCTCDCGERRVVAGSALRAGSVVDCGTHANAIPPGPDLSVVELAWAAGMFEGEGSVRINSATTRNLGALLVDLVNTDQSLVQWFHERWPGYLGAGAFAGNRRPFWRWRIASLRAASFLIAIEPFVVGAKRERVRLGIEFQRQKRASHAHNCDDAYRERQRLYHGQMKALNARGAPVGTQMLLLPLTTIGTRRRTPETVGRVAGEWT